MKELPTAAAGNGSGEPAPHQVASARLIMTLAFAGALAGLVIVLVFGWAEPQIQAHRAAALRAAVNEVLSDPASYRSVYVTESGLSDAPPVGADTVNAEKVFLGFDAAGTPVGYAITGAEPGYQDLIQLIFGYDPATQSLLGMKVLESKETPGLGDKIYKDMDFVTGFEGVETPIVGVKQGAGTGADDEVDMITGATISSRTVIAIINHRVEALGSDLEEHAATAPRAPASPDPASVEQPVEGGVEGS
jgi:electron transport complex protein RnfG